MNVYSRRRPRSVLRAFSREARRMTLLFVVAGVCAFAWVTDRGLGARAERSLADRAQLCVASLEPGRDGDLTQAVVRLQARYDRLFAVATLSASDQLEQVYPERPAYRSAAMAVLESSVRRAEVASPFDGETISVSGAIVPVNGGDSPGAQQALVLFRTDDPWTPWNYEVALYAVVLGAIGFCFAGALIYFFDRRIASEFRYLASVADELPTCPAEIPTITPGRWYETAAIGERFQELIEEIACTNARARRARRESEKEIRQRERGFDQELRRAHDKATMDALTRLRNRAFFEERLEPFFIDQRENARDLAAVMIDVDNFKQYNDLHGHQAGDMLLKFVGALLRGAVRPEDYAIRYGGDEFLLLLPDTGAGQASDIAERLVKLFGQYTGQLERAHSLSLSVGVASLQAHGAQTGHQLVARADQALYLAKRQGKNTVARYPRGPAETNKQAEPPNGESTTPPPQSFIAAAAAFRR